MEIKLTKIVDYLKETFNYQSFEDSSINGLQVEAKNYVTKIGAAVDFGSSIASKAKLESVDLLITHHGLLWNSSPIAITDDFGLKIQNLIRDEINLVGIHLPLDAHPKFGNNAIIMKDHLGFDQIEPAIKYGSQKIGFKTKNSKQIPLSTLFDLMKSIHGGIDSPLLINFGPAIPENICVVSGGAADSLYQFKEENFDTLITGEPRQFAYHFCKENKLNAIFAGHYGTETFGVCAIAKNISETFGIPWTFIDEPTGV